MKVVIDADSLVYRAGFAVEQVQYAAVQGGKLLAHGLTYSQAITLRKQGQDVELYRRSIVEPFDNARQALRSMLKVIYGQCKARFGEIHAPTLLLTGGSNFRERIATVRAYKHNRTKDKPPHYAALRQHLIDEFKATVVHWYEADDEAAMLLTAGGEDVCVSSLDKDLLQVPGWHHVHDKGFLKISEKSGLLRFYMQALSGDPTDGIPGCRGVGATGARKLILEAAGHAKNFKDLESRCWSVVHAQYRQSLEKHGAEKCGYTDPLAAAKETAQLVYLLRTPPKDVRWIDLWEAPK
jgi:hypothetical protein